jgi:hypothetical protein
MQAYDSNCTYFEDIAKGLYPKVRTWAKIGFAGAVTTEQDMAPWFGTGEKYVFPSSMMTLGVYSNNHEDKGAGAGARTVMLYYLNSSYIEHSALLTLNGTGGVSVGSSLIRVNNMRVMSAGSNNCNIGNMALMSSAVTYGYITATKNRQRQCIYTVPSGKNLFINNISFSCEGQVAAKYMRFTTIANQDDKSGLKLQENLFMPYHEIIISNQPFDKHLYPPTRIKSMVDLKVKVYADSAGEATCALRGYLVED